jgi:hypothetical protein
VVGLLCVVGTGASACGDHYFCGLLVVIVWTASLKLESDGNKVVLMFVNTASAAGEPTERSNGLC